MLSGSWKLSSRAELWFLMTFWVSFLKFLNDDNDMEKMKKLEEFYAEFWFLLMNSMG